MTPGKTSPVSASLTVPETMVCWLWATKEVQTRIRNRRNFCIIRYKSTKNQRLIAVKKIKATGK
jgi:hypothetical protein